MNYDVENGTIYNAEVLKSNLHDYNDACILVRGDIIVIPAPATQVPSKNCMSFTKCITKIDGSTIDNAEDLYLVMPMYNLIEYSSNYSETTGSLWFYSKNKTTNFDVDIANNKFKCFEYKTKLLGNTVVQLSPNHANGILKIATIAVSLKYLSNFWRSLEISLINWKVELKLKWTKDYILAMAANDNINGNVNNIIFTIKDAKLYFPVVTLSAKDNQKLSKLFSKEFEQSSVYWSEYKTKSVNKNAANEYRYFLESNFVGANRFFVYSNEDGNLKDLKLEDMIYQKI